MTAPHRVNADKAAAVGARWVKALSCYRITTAYLLVALVIVLLLVALA